MPILSRLGIRRKDKDRTTSPQPTTPVTYLQSQRAELPASTNRPVSNQQSPVELFRSRGDDRTQNGDYNGAVIMYSEALVSAPNDTTILLSRSFAQSMTTPPRLDLALQDADAVLQQSPSSWRGWLQKGETHLKMGDYQGAEDSLRNAVGFAPELDKLTARRSLADAKLQRSRSATAELSGSSVIPNSPSLSSELPSQVPTQNAAPLIGTSPPASTLSVPKTPTLSPVSTTTRSPPPASPVSSITQPIMSQPSTLPPSSSQRSTSQPSTSQSPITQPSTTRPSTTQPLNSRLSTGQASNPTPATILPPPNTSTQTQRTAPIVRPQGTTTTPQAPVSTLPLGPEDLIDFTTPTDAPPSYSPNLNNPDPTIRGLSRDALETQLMSLETSLVTKNKGSLSVRPYTAAGTIDAIQLYYVGMIQAEMTARELGTPTYPHPSFRSMAVDAINYPGQTFRDIDCESSGYYEGGLPGTVSISGYSEEYREYQLSLSPLINIALEGQTVPPVMTLETIVNRIRLLQRQPTLEDNEALRNILGLSQLNALQDGFNSVGGRQRQIEAICMTINGAVYNAPTRFMDFSKVRNFSNSTLGSTGIGLQNFLFQIMLGVELLIRLRKEPALTSYAGLVTDAVTALMIVSQMWMQNVTIQGPLASLTASLIPSPRYTLLAIDHQRHAEALIRFGELLAWPYMAEARHYIENAYLELTSVGATISWDVCDWLFGLILPGKIFRHHIMCALVYASPTVRSISGAPYWDNGIVVAGKSYWPKRTVLGRVLGGLRNPKSICGWIGPVPAPEGGPTGWIRLNARYVDCPVPVSSAEDALSSLGFDERSDTETNEQMLNSIVDPNEWSQHCQPATRPVTDTSRSRLKSIHLTLIPAASRPIAASSSTTATLPTEEYRASVDFEVNGATTTFTLYSNPVFVAAPPCVGRHPMHTRQAQKYLRGLVKASALKDTYPPTDTLLVIDATGEGEECVARAWCAERARNAVVRRGLECCFACATKVAGARNGLGFNVLIWSR